MKKICLLLTVILITGCATKVYNEPFINSDEVVQLEFGMSKSDVLEIMPEPPLYVKGGDAITSVWVYNVRTINVKSDKLSDGTIIANKSNSKIKHQGQIDNLFLTFNSDSKLLAWGPNPYNPNASEVYYDCNGVCNGDATLDECGNCIGSYMDSGATSTENNDSNGSFKLELNVEGSEDSVIIEGGK